MTHRFALLSLSLSLFLAVAPGVVSASEPAAAGEMVKLVLNWKPEPEFGGFFAAKSQGLYSKRHVVVEVVPGGSGTPVVQMLAAGKVDFGIVSADEVVISRAHGSDVVALFAVYQTNPQGIMVHASSPAHNLAELFSSPGLLALQRGLPFADFLLHKFPAAKVKIVPYQGGISSFLNDPQFSQQCFVTSEPLDAKKNGVGVRSFLVADEGYNPYTTVLATRSSFLKKNPQLVQAVVEGSREGWQSYLAHPEVVNKEMAALNKSMDLATFQLAAEAQKKLILTDSADGLGRMSKVRWSQLIEQLLALKVIDKKLEATEMFN